MKILVRSGSVLSFLVLTGLLISVSAHSATARRSARHAEAVHQARLYQQHLAKLSTLSYRHRKRLIAHQLKVERIQLAKTDHVRHHRGNAAEQIHQERLAKREQAQHHYADRAQHLHQERLAKREVAQHQHVAAAVSHGNWRLHLQHLAEQHEERVAEHNVRLARIERAQAAHNARIALNRASHLATMSALMKPGSVRVWEDYVLSVPIKAISVDLNDPGVRVSALLANDSIGSAEPFSHMVYRSQPAVAVTGTFFSLDNLHPVGDIVINGNLQYFGGMGDALCITSDNIASMVTCDWGHHHDWTGYNFVMACGPRLLNGGNIVLDPGAERFRDRHMLSPNSRIGVGITRSNKLVFVMTKKPIFLGRLAKVMRQMGCVQAMNLDAGTSTGFYANGKMFAKPGRWLTNAIVVYTDQHSSQPTAS